jgi:hypothetical protein
MKSAYLARSAGSKGPARAMHERLLLLLLLSGFPYPRKCDVQRR